MFGGILLPSGSRTKQFIFHAVCAMDEKCNKLFEIESAGNGIDGTKSFEQ